MRLYFKPIMKYLWTVIKHKFYIIVVGTYFKVPVWRLLTHDLSKFKPKHVFYYALHDHARELLFDKNKFLLQWLFHQNSERHHWEFWVQRSDGILDSYNVPLEMPEKYIREMVSDWVAASMAYEGKWPTITNWDWYVYTYPKINITLETRKRVNTLLKEVLEN